MNNPFDLKKKNIYAYGLCNLPVKSIVITHFIFYNSFIQTIIYGSKIVLLIPNEHK